MPIGKVCYFDTETTGTDPDQHGVIQAAFIMEIDGEVQAEKTWEIRPPSGIKWNKEAAKIHGFTIEQVGEFMHEDKAKAEMTEWLKRYVDPFDKLDKLQPAAFNGDFDMDFLRAMWERCGDKYFGGLFNWQLIDPRRFANFLIARGALVVPNVKQETLRQAFGIKVEGDAHDALVDVRVCRELVHAMMDMIDVSQVEAHLV